MKNFARVLRAAERRAQAPYGFRGPVGGGMWGNGVDGRPVRLIANRTMVGDSVIGTLNPIMQRFATFSSDAIGGSGIKVAWSNWAGNETVPGTNVMTINASVEYPAGVFTQIKFGGSATGTAAPGTTLFSDTVVVPGGIPINTQFWIRFFRQGTTSFIGPSQGGPNLVLGEASDLPGHDQTMGGVIANTFNGISPPCAIIGHTNNPAVVVIGDSRQAGTGDNFQAANGGIGEMCSGLAPYAWTDLGIPGGQAAQYVASAGPLRAALIAFSTHLVDAYGTNDIFVAGASAAALEANQALIRALYPAQEFFVTTIDPETTSIDAWATLVNQTVRAQEAVRVTYNTAVRANSLGFNGSFDCAAVSESSLNSGKWKVDGTPNKYTIDGTHQSPFCYRLYSFVLPP